MENVEDVFDAAAKAPQGRTAGNGSSGGSTSSTVGDRSGGSSGDVFDAALKQQSARTGATDFLGKTKEFFNAASDEGARQVGNLASFIPGPIGRAAKKGAESFQQPVTDAQKAGAGAVDALSAFAPIPGLKYLKASAKAPMIAKGAIAAGRGAIDMGVRAAAQTGDAGETAGAMGTGAALGGGGELLAGPASKLLKTLSRSQYGKILHPLGRQAKEITEDKLLTGKASDLVGRKMIAGTTHGLRDKFQQEAEKAGKAVNAEYSRLDQVTKTKLKPLYDAMEDFATKNGVLPNGKVTENGKQYFRETMKLMNEVSRELGPTSALVSPKTVQALRRDWDKELFGKKLQITGTTIADMVKENAVNSIREVLHSQHPTSQAVDAQFNFWKSAATLMERRVTGDVGKYEFAKSVGNHWKALMGATIGAEGGREQGKSPLEIMYGAAAGAALGEAIQTTGWRSVSAVTKDKVADLLVSGKGQQAVALARRAVGRLVTGDGSTSNKNKIDNGTGVGQ